jgi:hypothetical protein
LDFLPPCKFLDFILFLAILINFLNSKIDLDYPKFLFKIPSESKGVSMEKVVHLFEIFKTVFYLKFYEQERVLFGSNEV